MQNKRTAIVFDGVGLSKQLIVVNECREFCTSDLMERVLKIHIPFTLNPATFKKYVMATSVPEEHGAKVWKTLKIRADDH